MSIIIDISTLTLLANVIKYMYKQVLRLEKHCILFWLSGPGFEAQQLLNTKELLVVLGFYDVLRSIAFSSILSIEKQHSYRIELY